MSRTKGSKNKKKNVLSGTLHKQIESEDGKSLPVRKNGMDQMWKGLSSMPSGLYAELEEITSSNPDSAYEIELQGIYARLREEGKDHQEALLEVRKRKESSSPSRLHETVGSDMALPPLPSSPPQNEPIKFCTCSHSKEVHYGGKKGHCNTLGCICDGFYS